MLLVDADLEPVLGRVTDGVIEVEVEDTGGAAVIPPGSTMRPLATPSASPTPPSRRVMTTRSERIRTWPAGSMDHTPSTYFA